VPCPASPATCAPRTSSSSDPCQDFAARDLSMIRTSFDYATRLSCGIHNCSRLSTLPALSIKRIRTLYIQDLAVPPKMLALYGSSHGSKKSQLNILPCKIHRNGPCKVTKRLWSPMVESGEPSFNVHSSVKRQLTCLDGSKTAYFRGRKLRGRRIKLPNGYRGICFSNCTRRLQLMKNARHCYLKDRTSHALHK
jgi:Ribonuclease H2 non-catalytic subunit (Ylr154p-like)